jgi:NADH dehydrogenase/NADH:ubiquinone oxidoreductase subunit G
MFTIRFGKERLVLSNGRKLESVNIGYTYEGDAIIDFDTAKALELKGIIYNKEERALYFKNAYFVINYGGGKASSEILEAFEKNTPLSKISLKNVTEIRFRQIESLG